MSKRSQIILRVALGLLPVLAGCQSIRSAAGLDKPPPDEFAVLTKAPLIIPPDYNLRPPSPGAAPINQQEPTEAAQSAMFGPADAGNASGIAGNFTPGERTLLANAGVQNADPSIRAELQSDEKTMQGADASFTDKILGTPDDNGQPVNADAEASRTKTSPTKPSDSVTIQKSRSGGWFDWF